MGLSAHGATFTFVGSLNNVQRSFQATIVGLSVETPTAEIVDMTSVTDPPGSGVLVPTGEWIGGTVSVDYLATQATGDIQLLVRSIGPLTFASPGMSITRRVILESASMEARVGELVRGSATFRVTDYYGT
jgi:hypothetical protein